MFRIEIITKENNQFFHYADDRESAMAYAMKNAEIEDVADILVFKCQYDGNPRDDKGELVWSTCVQ